jgi:hypothetical protein
MLDFYCHICKDYIKHSVKGEDAICDVCGTVYDKTAKRYIITGPDDDALVLKAKGELLAANPDAIIISEKVALDHKLKGLAMRPSELAMKIEAPYLFQNHIEDMRYAGLTKKEREADIQPVRTEPKIGRNELCPCGSGKKYKKCCSKNS